MERHFKYPTQLYRYINDNDSNPGLFLQSGIFLVEDILCPCDEILLVQEDMEQNHNIKLRRGKMYEQYNKQNSLYISKRTMVIT